MAKRVTADERRIDAQVSRFIADRMVLHVNLVCPARIVWTGYQKWCEDGFEEWHPPAHFFASLCRAGVELHQRGRGKFRRVASGIGFRREDSDGKAA